MAALKWSNFFKYVLFSIKKKIKSLGKMQNNQINSKWFYNSIEWRLHLQC